MLQPSFSSKTLRIYGCIRRQEDWQRLQQNPRCIVLSV